MTPLSQCPGRPAKSHRGKIRIVFEDVYVTGVDKNATKFHRGGKIACRVSPGSEISGYFSTGKNLTWALLDMGCYDHETLSAQVGRF